MIPPRTPGPDEADRAVALAEETDLDVLSQVIADALFDLAPSRWLIDDPDARRQIFPGYFRIYVEHALATGMACTTPGRAAAALWLPAGEPASPPDGHDARLAAVTGRRAERFHAFDAALEDHHPAGITHWHLAIMAVRPDQQGRGTGSTLLRFTHQRLDATRTPAYLEASSPRARDLYLRHGYTLQPGAPFHLPGGGPPLWPMWRQPRTHGQDPEHHGGSVQPGAPFHLPGGGPPLWPMWRQPRTHGARPRASRRIRLRLAASWESLSVARSARNLALLALDRL